MNPAFTFELLTPDGAILSDKVEALVVPGEAGYFGVLAGHEHLCTVLGQGVLTVRWPDRVRCYDVTGGLIQVTPHKVVICAERATLKGIADR